MPYWVVSISRYKNRASIILPQKLHEHMFKPGDKYLFFEIEKDGRTIVKSEEEFINERLSKCQHK